MSLHNNSVWYNGGMSISDIIIERRGNNMAYNDLDDIYRKLESIEGALSTATTDLETVISFLTGFGDILEQIEKNTRK